jgi:GH25 family lysozyme M1 (1,4-beta-N-acetylmuramidase)
MTTEEMRLEAVRLMKSREKRNTYTNGGKRQYFFGYPNEGDKGWSDCSSAVRACVRRAADIDIGSNTDRQIRNRVNGEIVDQTDGYYPDESKLLPGDCLYFKGNGAHALDVGHVEMYVGDNECWGHGSGTGPNRHDMRAYCKSRATAKKRYFMAVRWVDGGVQYALGDREMRNGCKGDDVTALQTALIAAGYDCGKWGADGDYGPATAAAVMAFEVAHGLPMDGVFSAECFEILNGNLPEDVDRDEENEDDEITEPEPDIEDDEPETPAKLVRATASVYVRSLPDKQSGKKLDVLAKGKTLPYGGVTQDGWHQATYKGVAAWVSGKYSELIDPPARDLILDISQYQTVTDWEAIRARAAFLILRAGLRSQTATGALKRDSKFDEFAQACNARGIPFGAYWFVRSGTVAGAKEEAAAFVEYASAYAPKFWMADAEVGTLNKASIEAFVAETKRLAGTDRVGAYIAHHRYKSYGVDAGKLAFVVLPRYGANTGEVDKLPAYTCDLHQFTSRGRVEGITGNVDMNRITGAGKTIAWFRGEAE